MFGNEGGLLSIVWVDFGKGTDYIFDYDAVFGDYYY